MLAPACRTVGRALQSGTVLTLGLLAMGCGQDGAAGAAADDAADTTGLEGGGSSGGGGGSDGSTDDGLDSGASPDTVSVQVRVHEPSNAIDVSTPLRVSLIPVGFGESVGGPRLGVPLADAPVVDGVATLTLPEALPADALDGLARAIPDAQGAIFALVAWQPVDDVAEFAEGQPLLGVALDRLVLYLAEGDMPPGWTRGWSLLDSGMAGMYAPNRCLYDTTEPMLWRESEGYPRFYGLYAGVDLLLRGRPAALELAVQFGLLSSAPERYSLVPHQLAAGTDPSVRAEFDVPLPAPGVPLSALLDRAPPDNHDLTGDPDWRHTLAYGVPYVDIDDSGSWSAEDPAPTIGTCVDRMSVAFRYTRPVSTWRGLRMLDCYSGQVGWRLVRWDESVGNEVYLPAESGLSLRVEDGCGI